MEVASNRSSDGTFQIPVDQPNRVSFDDALSMAKFGKFNVIFFVLAGTILTAFLLEILGISYVVAVADQDLQITIKEKGILSAIGFIGVIVSSHLWGFLSDTYGRRRVIIPTLFITFVVSTISSFTTSFWSITFLRFLAGFFISGSSATIYAYVGEFHSRKNSSRAIMAVSFVYGLGGILLPGIAYVVLSQGWQLPIPVLGIIYRPWRLYLVVCSLPGVVCALILLLFPESPKFTLNQGDMQKAIEAIQWVHRFNSNCREPALKLEYLECDVEDQQEKFTFGTSKDCSALSKLVWKQTAPLFMGSHLRATTIVCVLQFGTYLTAHGMLMFLPQIVDQVATVKDSGVDSINICQIVHDRMNFGAAEDVQRDESNQTLHNMVFELSLLIEVLYAVGFAVIGVIINTVGRLSILVSVFVCCGVAGMLVIFVNAPTVVISLYVVLLMSGFTASVVNAVVVDLYPTSLRAMAVCIALMFGRLGTVIGSNMLGVLLENYCELTFVIPSVLLIVCGLLSFFIPNIRKANQSVIA